MKRHTSLIPLSHDHHMTLLLAQVMKKNAPAYAGMSTVPADKVGYIKTHYSSHLVKHFETEENILFTVIKGHDRDTDLLIEELVRDHREIATRIAALGDAPDLEEQLNGVGELLDQHIRKEERILFEKIPLFLSQEELTDLEKRIPKSAF